MGEDDEEDLARQAGEVSMTLAPRQAVDRYRVETQIGEGGLSVVYRVRHVVLGTVHALKVLRMESPEVRHRLLREGRVQAALQHPNVVAVRDIMKVRNTLGLLMDYVDGGSLSDFLRSRPLDLHEIDTLARGIIEGVSAAHHAGLVHRDLKPANVLLSRDGTPMVTDFGLARVLTPQPGMPQSTSPTRSRMLMGTPSYMSPEQIENARQADQRSDLFSLGALLYEVATGRRAFTGDKIVDILYKISRGTQVPVQQLRPDLPQRIVNAIDVALQPDRRRRVETAEQLLSIWMGHAEPETSLVAYPVAVTTLPRINVVKAATPVSTDTLIPSAPPNQTIIPSVTPAPVPGRNHAPTPVPRAVSTSIEDDIPTHPPSLSRFQPALTPQSEMRVAMPVPIRRRRRQAPVWAPILLGALCAMIVLSGVGLGGWLAMHAPTSRLARTTAGAGVEAAAVPAVAIVEHVDEAFTPLWGSTDVDLAEAPQEDSGQAAPSEGAPPLVIGARVHIEGGVQRASLLRRADGRVVKPGPWVPPGLYDLSVEFPDGTTLVVNVGLLAEARGAYVVRCDPDFYTCTVSES